MSKQGPDRTRQSEPGSGFDTRGGDVKLLIAALLPPTKFNQSSHHATRLQHAVGTPDAVDEAVDLLMARLGPDLQRHLDSLDGRNLGKIGNAEFAKSLTRMLRRLGFQLECCQCGLPAVALRYSRAGNANVFRFEHTPSVRHGGTTAIPRLELIARDNSTR